MFFTTDVLCQRCRQRLALRPQRIVRLGFPVTGLYMYQGLARDMVLRLKERGDEALAPAPLWPLAHRLARMYRGWMIVPMPSSRQAEERRGFDPVAELWAPVGLPLTPLLIKTDDYVQKDQPLARRGDIAGHIALAGPLPAIDRPVLLVDDIMTSGATMARGAALLRDHAPRLAGLAVAYSRLEVPAWWRRAERLFWWGGDDDG